MTQRVAIIFLAGCFCAWHADLVAASEDREHPTEIRDTESFILDQAREQLEQHFSSGDYRFTVEPRWIPGRLLEQSPEQISAIEISGEVKRYTNFEVLYRRNGDRNRIEIQLKVKAEQKLPVVLDRVRRGEALTEEKLAYRWVSLSRNSGKYITDMNSLTGKKLRRTLLSGQPVRQSFISREFIIKAGDEVKVVIEQNGIQVQVTGEARENGAEGDRIKIYSTETRKKYVGEVIRPGVTQWKNTL